MKLSAHYDRSEFACKCGCGYDTVDTELLTLLNIVRNRFEAPVTINSGCRCVEHNEQVQKEVNADYVPYSSKSQHLLGRAADIVVQGVVPSEVYAFINAHKPLSGGAGNYATFTHCDSRNLKARW